MSLVRVVAPAVEPVTIREVQDRVRDWDSANIPQLADLLVAAREKVEGETGLALIEQDWCLYLSGFPKEETIELARSPLVEVASVKYYDTANTLQTLETGAYWVVTHTLPGGIVLADGESWPDTYARPDAVQITFTAGFGETGDKVPARLKLALKDTVVHNYDQRGEIITGTIVAEIPDKVKDALQFYRVGGWVA